jgi:hypothetical protein
MATRRKEHEHKSADLFLDISILPVYRLCKIFASKTPFKESFMKQKSHFIFDCFCAAFWGYVTYWIGSWNTFGHQWIFFWELGGGILLIILTCFIIGKLRRKPSVYKVISKDTLNDDKSTSILKQRIANEEKREFTEAPKVSFSPKVESNDTDVKDALKNMGYKPAEIKSVMGKIPQGTLEDRIIEALRNLDNNKVTV